MPIFLTPSNEPLTDLMDDLRDRLHCLVLNMIDEDLSVETAYTVYQAGNKRWLSFPKPRIRKIDVDGFEELLLEGTDYTINYVEGKVTLVIAATADEAIRADYDFDVFTDTDLEGLLVQSAREIQVALHRSVDEAAIPDEYKEAILKRAYTNAFKCLIQPTFNFYSVTVMGRSVDKTMLADTMLKIIDMNEKLLEKDINSLRNFNQTNRFE